MDRGRKEKKPVAETHEAHVAPVIVKDVVAGLFLAFLLGGLAWWRSQTM